MIHTVTLNPSVDRMYFIDTFEKDGTIRPKEYFYDAGGKGINVTKVLNALDVYVHAYGFLGGTSGLLIKNAMEAMNVNALFTPIDGESRTSISIKASNGEVFELAETGPSISQVAINEIMHTLQSSISENDIVILSGSLPDGVPGSIYADIIELINEKGATVILDTSGQALQEALIGKPSIIKPNLEELKLITTQSMNDELSMITACRSLIGKGAGAVALSLGASGMLYVTEETVHRVHVPTIDAINPVGSGDASVAGMAYAISKHYDISRMLKYSNACGISNAMHKRIGEIDPKEVNELLNSIEVREYTK